MNTTKIKLRKNLLPWLKEQLSRPGWFKNFIITRNAWAAFSINSHIRRSNGEPKMTVYYDGRSGYMLVSV